MSHVGDKWCTVLPDVAATREVCACQIATNQREC